jgi:uncharacterized SAM-binding protein YcdF (DUF218 family)
VFALKNLIGTVAMPLAAASLAALTAVLCRIAGRRRLALGLIIAAGTIGYLGSVSIVGDALLEPLERQYPPLPETAVPAGVQYVLVLGSGYVPRDGVPVTAALDEDGLVRIVEGVSIVRRLRDARLIVSGGAAPGSMPSALGYAKLAVQLGIDPKSLIVLDTPRDTQQEARAAAGVVGAAPFIMVTSAYHMPRAMGMMRAAGLHPIPAATGYALRGPVRLDWRRLVPNASGARKTEHALHEYLGLIAIHLGFA